VLPAYAHALDFDREVHGHGDRFSALAPPGPDDRALVTGDATFTHTELGALASAAQPPGGSLLVTAPLADLRSAMATVLVPLATGSRAVLCRHLDASRLAGRVAEEGVVAAVRPGGAPAEGEQTVTAALPEWNGPGAGMA
jgi:hypothetical protein